MATKNSSMPKAADKGPFGGEFPKSVKAAPSVGRNYQKATRGSSITAQESKARYERWWYLRRKGQTFPGGA